LRTSSYDDRDGNKRYTTEIVATNILLQGGKGGERDAGESYAGPGDAGFDRGEEPHDYEPAPEPRGATSNSNYGSSRPPVPDDDDIPF
jgi:single-strand DNA-binding protein